MGSKRRRGRAAAALVVGRRGQVRAESPLRDGRGAGPRVQDEPRTGRRPIDRDVRSSIAVVIRGHRHVAVGAPLLAADLSRGQQDVPRAIRWSIDGDVGAPVAVVVGRHRDIEGVTPGQARHDAAARVADLPGVPDVRDRPVDREVGAAVAVEVRGDRQVAAAAPGRGLARAGARVEPVPDAGRGAIDRHVGQAIAIIVLGRRPIFVDAPDQGE